MLRYLSPLPFSTPLLPLIEPRALRMLGVGAIKQMDTHA